MSLRAIARMLGRSPSTISREVARNRGRRYYKAVDADNRAKRMAKRPKLSNLELNSELRQIVKKKLELKWSLEQISGWLRVEYSRRKSMHVSHETIYKSIYVRIWTPPVFTTDFRSQKVKLRAYMRLLY